MQIYTREALNRQRTARKLVERRGTRVLAVVAVGLGVAQLVLIRLLESRLPRSRAVLIEGMAFLGYAALVGWLLWRMLRRIRAARIACPRCGVLMGEMSERVAVATGRCDACGAQVVE